MPLLGAHMSITGGLTNAITAATSLGCGTVQLFTKNANQWAGKSLESDEVLTFRNAMRVAQLKYPTAHASYLINLAAPGDELFDKSIGAFTEELERAEALGLSYLVIHPGAHTGSGVDAGIARVVEAIDQVHSRCPGFKVQVLLENTAGQGTSLGANFHELAAVLDRVTDSIPLGVCFDTCHAFAAGHSLEPGPGYDSTFERFDDLIGLDRIKLFHLNDSLKPFGSRVDRHAGLGLGMMGLESFRRLVTDREFQDRPMILETPKEDDNGNEMDPLNLAVLRRFLATDTTARAG